jgi:hypothetical protein
MNTMHGIPLLAALLTGAGLAVVGQPVEASLEAECGQEAEEYGIPPEQREEYVSGCLESRGGAYAIEPPAEDDNPYAGVYETETGETGETSETSETGEAGEGSGYVPQ